MNRNNIAVLTFCNNNGPANYGQILQCYAVQNIFEDMGFQVKVVLYQKLSVGELPTVRVRKFQEFVSHYIHTSEYCNSLEEVEKVTEDCRTLVCGSDQIWHPDTIDRVWALDFGGQEKIRISFAASGLFTDNEYTCKCIEKYLESFKRFHLITVREDIAGQILKRYTGRDIRIMPDPTLLLLREKWERLASGQKDLKNYIFCYCLGGIRPYSLILRRLSEWYGNAEIKYIPTNLLDEVGYGFMKPIYDAGPAEFLSLIQNAKAVVTDSFHGVVFSAMFQKDWYCMERYEAGADRFGGRTRINQLIKNMGAASGWVSSVSEARVRYEVCKRGLQYPKKEKLHHAADKMLENIDSIIRTDN